MSFIHRHLEHIDPKKLIIICSKSDTFTNRKQFSLLGQEVLYISSVTGEGIENLKSKIVDIALKK